MVDIKELEALLQRLEDVGKREEACVKATKDLAGRFLTVVTKATPVKTGYLRLGWTGGVKQSPYLYGKKQPVAQKKDEYTIELKNEVKYASYVELGHRIMRNGVQIGVVPPKYFVKKTEETFEPQANGFVKKTLEKYLQGVLDGK